MFDKIIKHIVDAHKPTKIYVYGSYAFGFETKTSDIDICVLKNDVSAVKRYDWPLDKKISMDVEKEVNTVYCTEMNGWCQTEIYPKYELK